MREVNSLRAGRELMGANFIAPKTAPKTEAPAQPAAEPAPHDQATITATPQPAPAPAESEMFFGAPEPAQPAPQPQQPAQPGMDGPMMVDATHGQDPMAVVAGLIEKADPNSPEYHELVRIFREMQRSGAETEQQLNSLAQQTKQDVSQMQADQSRKSREAWDSRVSLARACGIGNQYGGYGGYTNYGNYGTYGNYGGYNGYNSMNYQGFPYNMGNFNGVGPIGPGGMPMGPNGMGAPPGTLQGANGMPISTSGYPMY
ncbi:MAG: hypothetical protein KC910_22850 [Candidatus Eremiobacteraeota bacterium]|nr:hypothetical protein [Candidatus Eremiobacteraeota bacterium]